MNNTQMNESEVTQLNIVEEELERYLCFSMGAEEFAIPLLTVIEVLAVPPVTPVPSNPPYILGIINIRGQIVSIMDLRIKLGLKPVKSEEESVIICHVGGNTIGIVVDSINSVIIPQKEFLSPKPTLRNPQYGKYITNLYRTDDKMIMFIELKDIFTSAK